MGTSELIFFNSCNIWIIIVYIPYQTLYFQYVIPCYFITDRKYSHKWQCFFACGSWMAKISVRSSYSKSEEPGFKKRSFFFSDWRCFNLRTFSFAFFERFRFCLFNFSIRCCSSLSLPRIMFWILFMRIRRAKKRFNAWERSC